MHVASVAWQSLVSALAHSSTSTHVTPSPVKPEGQVQLNEPARLTQPEATKQLCAPVAHSSISVHALSVAL